MFKKNPLTTIGGVLAAVGAVLGHTPNPLTSIIGMCLSAAGLVLLGGGAKDFNVTGVAKPENPIP